MVKGLDRVSGKDLGSCAGLKKLGRVGCGYWAYIYVGPYLYIYMYNADYIFNFN